MSVFDTFWLSRLNEEQQEQDKLNLILRDARLMWLDNHHSLSISV